MMTKTMTSELELTAISENLKRMRKSRFPSPSCKQVADKLGISRSTYARYENGTSAPPLWVIQKAAVFYAVPYRNLLETTMITKEGDNL